MGRLPRNAANYAMLAAIFAVLGVGLVYPIVLTLRGAFLVDPASGKGVTLVNLQLLFEDPTILRSLWNSLRVAAVTTVLATLIAMPLAMLSARYRFPFKGALSALVLVPLILPPFVGAIGLKMVIGREGALHALLSPVIGDFDILGRGKFVGVVIVQALSLFPIVLLNVSAALANLDPALDEAATNLGAGPWRRFFRVTLPLIRPGLLAGCTLVFIWALTELGTPLMFDYTQVIPVKIFNGLKEVETSAQPYALTYVLLVLAVGSYAIGRWVLGSRGAVAATKASRAAGERELGPWAKWGAAGLFAVVIAVSLVPHAGVVLTALAEPGSWYRSVLPRAYTLAHFDAALTHPESFGAIVNSLKLSSAAVAIDLVLGVLVGYLIVRTNIRGRRVLDALCMLPLAVPGLVLAFGYVAATLRWPFGKGDVLEGLVSVVGAAPNPVPLLILAYALRRLPYVVRATVSGLEQTSGELEEAAWNLGASRLTAARRVVVPLISANLIAGGLLAFAFAMLEVSDSLILAQQPQNAPITKAIFSFANRLADGLSIASAMGVWGMALLAVTLAGASALIGKRIGAVFRG